MKLYLIYSDRDLQEVMHAIIFRNFESLIFSFPPLHELLT